MNDLANSRAMTSTDGGALLIAHDCQPSSLRTVNNNESTIKLTEWTSCGGCAAKWGASLLSDLVRDLPESFDSSLLVGLAPFDDAAVYQLTPEVALVSTTDFPTACG